MRTLLDLLDDERGYVRIYEEREGFGYELSMYAQQPIADMFERMNGYDSFAAAQEAARLQLCAAGQVRARAQARPTSSRRISARRRTPGPAASRSAKIR
jgi:predicted nucleic acid-binding Zn ribbon protein